jgi:hypothetical protein
VRRRWSTIVVREVTHGCEEEGCPKKKKAAKKAEKK